MKSFPYLPLDVIESFVPLMRERGVSKVARSSRGFLTAYREADGDVGRLDPWWRQRRSAFIARHFAQVQQRSEPLYEARGRHRGEPTRRHLALIAWAWSPDGDAAQTGQHGQPNRFPRGRAVRHGQAARTPVTVPGARMGVDTLRTLWHGTTAEQARGLLQSTRAVDLHLTLDKDNAGYYAEQRAKEDFAEDAQPVLVSADLQELRQLGRLLPDYAELDGREYDAYDMTWQDSLRYGANVVYTGPLPKSLRVTPLVAFYSRAARRKRGQAALIQRLRIGQTLYHGTSAKTRFDYPDGPAWFSEERSVAESFTRWHGAGGSRRVLVYEVVASPKLARIVDTRAASRLSYELLGEDTHDIKDLAYATCDRYDGWIVPNNYSPGADIMLCEPERWLKFIRTERP